MSESVSLLHTLRPIRRWLLDVHVVHKVISVLLMTAGILAVLLAAVR